MKIFNLAILCVLLTKICCQNLSSIFDNVRLKRQADQGAHWSVSDIYKPRRRLSGDVIERQAAFDHGYRQRIYNQWTKEWDMRVDMNSHYWPSQNRPFANYAPRGLAGGGLRPLGESSSEGQLLLPNRQILTPSFERDINEAHLDNIMRNSQRSSLPVSSITTYPSADSFSFASSPSSYSSIISPTSSATTYPSESPSSLSSSDALRSLPASFKELYRSKMHPNIAENAARPRPFPVDPPSPQQSPRISQPPPPAPNVPPAARGGRGGLRNRFRNLRQNIGQRFRRFFGRKK